MNTISNMERRNAKCPEDEKKKSAPKFDGEVL